MPTWNRPVEWWHDVDRKEVIIASIEISKKPRTLILAGPDAFGHLEAAILACRTLERRDWICHDLTTMGPISPSDVMIAALESAFPTAPGALSHRGQVGQLGLRLLRDHCDRLFAADERRHCFVVPYLDSEEVVTSGEADALERFGGERVVVLATVTRRPSVGSFGQSTVVHLTGFTTRHVELCLQGKTEASSQQIEQIRPTLALLAADDIIVPSAAYSWLQAAWSGPK